MSAGEVGGIVGGVAAVLTLVYMVYKDWHEIKERTAVRVIMWGVVVGFVALVNGVFVGGIVGKLGFAIARSMAAAALILVWVSLFVFRQVFAEYAAVRNAAEAGLGVLALIIMIMLGMIALGD